MLKSTITNLLELSNDLTKERYYGNNVDIVCIDLAKTLDTVLHKQLIYKLSLYGIKGNLLNWISDYLSMRKMYVCIKENRSDIHNANSSVPQGSVLTPYFFCYI